MSTIIGALITYIVAFMYIQYRFGLYDTGGEENETNE